MYMYIYIYVYIYIYIRTYVHVQKFVQPRRYAPVIKHGFPFRRLPPWWSHWIPSKALSVWWSLWGNGAYGCATWPQILFPWSPLRVASRKSSWKTTGFSLGNRWWRGEIPYQCECCWGASILLRLKFIKFQRSCVTLSNEYPILSYFIHIISTSYPHGLPVYPRCLPIASLSLGHQVRDSHFAHGYIKQRRHRRDLQKSTGTKTFTAGCWSLHPSNSGPAKTGGREGERERERSCNEVWEGLLLSADPGLCHGRGGAWDHRRCGTCFLARHCLSANLGSDSRHSLCFKLSSSRGRPFLQDLRPWQSNPTSPWCRGNVLLWRFKAAVCQPWKLAKPFPAAPRCHSGHGSNKSLRPWKCPFMEVQGSLKNSPNLPLQLPGATQAAADLSCSSNKALRPWQCPFMEVQGCRLPALKTRQALPCSSQAPLRPRQTFLQLQQVPEAVAVSSYGSSRLPFASLENSPNPPLQLAGATQAAADFPAAPTSPWGRGSVLLWKFKAAVCQPWRLAKPFPAAPRRHAGHRRPFLQLQQVPRPWQCPFMEVQGCRLPALKTRQTIPCSSQAPLRPRQTFPAAPASP